MEKEIEFERFFKENYSRFYYFAFQLIGEKEVCKDIVSDSFEQTWLFFQRNNQQNLTSYVYSLVRNKCVDYIRREMAKKRYAEFYIAMFDECDDYDACEEMDWNIKEMYRLMDAMTPRTREILEMCYYHKKTYAETAEKLGISVSAVRKHIVNALKIFRSKIVNKNK